MKNAVIIRSIDNFRDMGGIPVKGGKLKGGMLFRSAQLGTASKKDTEKFKQLHIAHVFDFREDRETEKCPDFTVEGTEFHRVPAAPTKDAAFVALEKRDEKQIKKISKEEAESHARIFAELYATSSFGNPAFRAVFDAMDEGAPILFHCVGGRDRTGTMAALLLLALGADRETIISDYLLTNQSGAAMRRLIVLLAFLKTGNMNAVAEMKTFVYANRRNMESIFAAIDKKYASIDDFLLCEYGVTAERLAKWRGFYVE